MPVCPATSSRSRLLLALDRMIDSAQEEISENDPGNHATIGMLHGELKGLMAARAYAELEEARLKETPSEIEAFKHPMEAHVEQLVDVYGQRPFNVAHPLNSEQEHENAAIMMAHALLAWVAPKSIPSASAASPDAEDAARYRWFRDECDLDRRVEILEVSEGVADYLDHHIDKGRCGL